MSWNSGLKLRKKSRSSRGKPKKCKHLHLSLKTQLHTYNVDEQVWSISHEEDSGFCSLAWQSCRHLNVMERKVMQVQGGWNSCPSGLKLVSHGGGHISVAWGHHVKTHTRYGELVEQNDKDKKSLEIISCERWLKNSISFGKESSLGEGDKCSHWLPLHQGLPWIWCICFLLLLLKKSDHKPSGL